jgi:hypothetical protein
MQYVAGPGGTGPCDFSPCPDQAARDPGAFDQERHGDCGGMPSAGNQAVKEGVARGILIQMEGLGVELARERLDLLAIKPVLATPKALAGREIFKIERNHAPDPSMATRALSLWRGRLEGG